MPEKKLHVRDCWGGLGSGSSRSILQSGDYKCLHTKASLKMLVAKSRGNSFRVSGLRFRVQGVELSQVGTVCFWRAGVLTGA